MCMWIRLGVRWQCIGGEDVWIGGRIGQRWKENSPWVFLKLGDRTTVKDRRWGEFGVTGVGRNRRLLRSGGSAFRTLTDRHLVCWSAFGSLIGVWIVLSLSRYVCSLSVFCCVLFTECVSLFCTCYENRLKIKRLCKMISGSTSVNFGQTKIIFRKIYFP